ncbi:MAG: hypothetical protein CSA81_13425 [Acidobacteria bacterium]|nr:MAG: hypothetical protein CSA81_13425 [Acidobacteriota bacterium]
MDSMGVLSLALHLFGIAVAYISFHVVKDLRVAVIPLVVAVILTFSIAARLRSVPLKIGREVVREVAREVNLDPAPLKGDCQFSSQIRINFRDGKLRSINLIPNTTKPLE